MQPEGHQFFKDTDGAMLRVVGVYEFGGRRWTTYARIANGYGSVVTVHSSGGEPDAVASAKEWEEAEIGMQAAMAEREIVHQDWLTTRRFGLRCEIVFPVPRSTRERDIVGEVTIVRISPRRYVASDGRKFTRHRTRPEDGGAFVLSTPVCSLTKDAIAKLEDFAAGRDHVDVIAERKAACEAKGATHA